MFPFLVVITQSSSDYISPYELPLVAKMPTDEVKETEAPAAGKEATASVCFSKTQPRLVRFHH